MAVLLSFLRTYQRCAHWTDFQTLLWISVQKTEIRLKLDKNVGRSPKLAIKHCCATHSMFIFLTVTCSKIIRQEGIVAFHCKIVRRTLHAVMYTVCVISVCVCVCWWLISVSILFRKQVNILKIRVESLLEQHAVLRCRNFPNPDEVYCRVATQSNCSYWETDRLLGLSPPINPPPPRLTYTVMGSRNEAAGAVSLGNKSNYCVGERWGGISHFPSAS